ncbi:MAG TPA: ribonuclease Z, partial [Massilibacterium sp.]|nr:ribonuclease Z [Massilibacterium sp.]
MQLTFLGTGAGMPAKERNVSSIALTWLNASGEVWLFDCGEATQHQILRTSIKPSKISRIFITHLHGDHIYGLLGLLSSRSFLNGTTPLYLYGPVGIRSFVETGLRVSGTHLNYQLVIEEMSEEMEWSTERATVTVRTLQHGIPSFGYRICEHDKVGPLQIEKLNALHIPKGPHFKLLKKGVDVSLQDGRVLKAKDFIGPKQKGRVVTILGDTRPTEASIELAKDADVCVHEATFSEREKDHA